MTIYSDFLDASRKWVARKDHSDELMATFLRSAEAYLDREMRVKESIVIIEDVFAASKFTLLADYNELVYIKPVDGKPLHWEPYDNFFSMDSTVGKYTMIGNTVIVDSDMATSDFEAAYYGKITPFLVSAPNTPNWLYTYYYDIYLQAVNSAALFYGQEWERAGALEERVLGWVAKANGNSKTAQTSGSPLVRRTNRRIG